MYSPPRPVLVRSGEAVVSDSAGVRIVVNPDGDFADRSVRWTVSQAPEVAIGDQAGDDAYLRPSGTWSTTA